MDFICSNNRKRHCWSWFLKFKSIGNCLRKRIAGSRTREELIVGRRAFASSSRVSKYHCLNVLNDRSHSGFIEPNYLILNLAVYWGPYSTFLSLILCISTDFDLDKHVLCACISRGHFLACNERGSKTAITHFCRLPVCKMFASGSTWLWHIGHSFDLCHAFNDVMRSWSKFPQPYKQCTP